MTEADELGVRIVEALGADATLGESMLALRLVRQWVAGDIDELPAGQRLDHVERIARVLVDAPWDDMMLAMELVAIWLADEATEPPTSRLGQA